MSMLCSISKWYSVSRSKRGIYSGPQSVYIMLFYKNGGGVNNDNITAQQISTDIIM